MPQAALQLVFRSIALSLSLIPGRGDVSPPQSSPGSSSWVGGVNVVGGGACLHVSRTAQEQMLCCATTANMAAGVNDTNLLSILPTVTYALNINFVPVVFKL